MPFVAINRLTAAQQVQFAHIEPEDGFEEAVEQQIKEELAAAQPEQPEQMEVDELVNEKVVDEQPVTQAE